MCRLKVEHYDVVVCYLSKVKPFSNIHHHHQNIVHVLQANCTNIGA